MLNSIRKHKEGFTIIEVMIVLAIAGLIMLIVLLAVPALQRTSRNTQRKNDVSNIIAAVTDYTNNNGGTLPPTNVNFDTAFAGENPKLGYYICSSASCNVQWTYVTTAPGGAPTLTASFDNVFVYNYYTCTATNPEAPQTGGGSIRSIVVVYWVEASDGSKTEQCVQS
jgi:prepilin-type N-terminal cleavage/methylation domain-containing protein